MISLLLFLIIRAKWLFHLKISAPPRRHPLAQNRHLCAVLCIVLGVTKCQGEVKEGIRFAINVTIVYVFLYCLTSQVNLIIFFQAPPTLSVCLGAPPSISKAGLKCKTSILIALLYTHTLSSYKRKNNVAIIIAGRGHTCQHCRSDYFPCL